MLRADSDAAMQSYRPKVHNIIEAQYQKTFGVVVRCVLASAVVLTLSFNGMV